MSKTTKKKHVEQEVLNQFELPQDNQQIVKVLASRGNNLHEVLTPEGDKYLVSMPPKFRKSIWIKRGDYIVVEPIEEGNKVKAEISQILLKEQIKFVKEEGKWPKAFEEILISSSSSDNDSDSEKLFKNTNRTEQKDFYESSSGSETDDEDCDEDEEEEEEDDHKSGSN